MARFFEMHPFVRAGGAGDGGSRSPRWEGLGRKGQEKTGTAPSYGAALMAAPPPPIE